MALAAELWQLHRGLPKDQQITRVCLKADIMIVASAKAAQADEFYSREPKLRKLAEAAGITPRDLPTHSENLFVNEEIRRQAEDESDSANP
jgi:hypothetical protein